MGLFSSNKKPPLPEQKITEEKLRKWGDPNEDVKYVCMGAKLQCQYCNPPMGDLMPTTEQIMLQDKLWATVGDKQPATNIIFPGLCTHPSQQRPLSSPPPCASVIKLGDWANHSETIVGNHNALLKKSTIRCNISNQNITITDSGQRATLENGNSSDKQQEKKQITDMYWVDKDNKKVDDFHLEETKHLVVETQGYKFGEEVEITFETNLQYKDGSQEKTLIGTVKSDGKITIKDIHKQLF